MTRELSSADGPGLDDNVSTGVQPSALAHFMKAYIGDWACVAARIAFLCWTCLAF
jgi:hypothetical protein